MGVRFDPSPTHVHLLYVWTYAYKAARRGSWEEAARDRERFQHRIERINQLIKPVLMKKLNQYAENKMKREENGVIILK